MNPDEAVRDILAMMADDPNQALAKARALVRAHPDRASAHRALAAALRGVGNTGEAERAELKAIEIGLRQPAVAAAEKALGEGKLEDAEQLIRPYLRQNPEDAGAALILGAIAERCGALREAENLYRRGALLAPAYLEARTALATLLNNTGRYEEALAVLEEALARDSNHQIALSLKSTLLVQYRRLDEAKTVLRRLLRAHPRDARGWMSYAHVLKTTGQVEESIAAYRRAADADPTSGNPWWGLSNLKTVKFEPRDIARMKAVLEGAGLSDDDRIHLYFALGKALDDARSYAEAFEAYAQGNAIRLAKAPHEPELVHHNVLKSERVFTPAFFAARAGAGYPAPDPIFIVSMPRSGSTLVEQILASHPAIEGTEELHDMERIASDLAPNRPPGAYLDEIEGLGHARLRELGKHYIDATRRHRTTRRPFFTDKMPSNWAYTGLIHAILPRAKIVDVRRHPLGCGFANFAQHYSWGINFAYDLDDIGRFYSDYVRTMAHFDRIIPGAVHRVFYEDLVEDPEREVRRLLDYLELPFEPACLRFYENDRAVHTPSSEQVRQPINRAGMERWQRYEPWLGPLKAALGPVLDCYPRVPEHWPQEN